MYRVAFARDYTGKNITVDARRTMLDNVRKMPYIAKHAWVRQLFPFMNWWPMVNRDTMRADGIAALTGAIIVLPQGVAFATLAGLPPQYGLYAAIVPAIIAALFGSSWHLVSGPTNVISIFLFASLSVLAEPFSAEYINLALTVTFLAGIMQLAMGVARMGALVNFISHTVVISFTASAALLIVAAQLKNFFGLDVPRGLSFLDTLRTFVYNFTDINLSVTAVGMATIVAGVVSRRRFPKFPYMISAMLAGSFLALLLNTLYGAARTGIPMLGNLPSGLPQFSRPDLTPDALKKTLPVAFAVMILALTEAVSIARAIATRTGQRIDGNQEFIGQGLSNITGAFFSGYASSGSFNRSGANYEAGARTPLAAVGAALILLTMLFVIGPLSQFLPIAVMGAILFMVAYSLIDLQQIRAVIRTNPRETTIMLATIISALLVHLEFAIYAGVLLSLIMYLVQTSRPQILDVKPDPAPDTYHFSADTGLPDCPQVKMLRVNGEAFFGAVDHMQSHFERVDEAVPTQKHLLILASGVNFVDFAGAEMLAHEAMRRRRRGGGLYFYRLKDTARSFLERGGFIDDIKKENIFTVRQRPMATIYPRLDSSICKNCELRIFAECKVLLPNGQPRVQPDSELAAEQI
jgi:sulfate permease, SulP family